MMTIERPSHVATPDDCITRIEIDDENLTTISCRHPWTVAVATYDYHPSDFNRYRNPTTREITPKGFVDISEVVALRFLDEFADSIFPPGLYA